MIRFRAPSHIALFALFAMLVACASAQVDLSTIQIGMTKEQVVVKLGPPRNVVGSKKFPDGVVEVLQYGHDADAMWDGRPGPPAEAYFLYFFNDELIQWGRSGDWEHEADHIYEVRIR